MGLIVADMHAHGHLHHIRTKWPLFGRLAFHGALVAIALVTQWVPILRNNINYGMSIINVQDHPELTFCDSIFAICLLMIVETSGFAQRILGNIVMRNFGKLTAGIYLLSPSLVFTIIPTLAISLHSNGSAASRTLGVSWLVLFAMATLFGGLFHLLVELPSKLIGEVVVEFLEGSGVRGARQMGRDGKLVKRHVGGGALLGKARPVLA